MAEKKLIVANWKMNFNMQEASVFLHKISELIKVHRDVEVVVAPSSLALQSLSMQVDHRKIKLASQNFYWRDYGPYTGEISANMLRGLVKYGIIGHSERRHLFGERDKDVRNKMQAAVRNHIIPILCIGETAAERADGETTDILHDQLMAGLSNLTGEEAKNIVVAYEPIWAVGTGDNALSHDVQTVGLAVRSQIKHLFGKEVAESIQFIYGGSVTAENSADYLATPGVDGLLLGGASTELYTFAQIIDKAHKE